MTASFWQIHSETVKNRLYIQLSGDLQMADIQAILKLTGEEVKKLKPGFCAISDVTELQPGSPGLIEQLMQMIILARKAGLTRIVRINGNSQASAYQFDQISRAVGFITAYASNIEEAEGLLDYIS